MKRNYAYWSLILLFRYYDVDRWIPLGKWNGEYHWSVHHDQFYLDLVVGVILLGAIFSFRANLRVGMVLSTAVLGLWSYLHLQTWWIPYIRGVSSPRAIAFYEQFLEHTQVWPKYGNHFPPDAEHTFLDVFVFPAFLLCLSATVRNLRGQSRRLQ